MRSLNPQFALIQTHEISFNFSVLFFANISLWAQCDSTDRMQYLERLNLSDNDSLVAYYDYVEIAEYLIMKEEYGEAASYYEKAFHFKPTPFFVDIENYISLCDTLEYHDKEIKYRSIIDAHHVKIGGNKAHFLWAMLSEDQADRIQARKKQEFIYVGKTGIYLRERDSLRYVQFLKYQ